jgi:hypothetical protein
MPALRARIAAAHARALAAGGDVPAAIATMESALDRLPEDGVPVPRVTLLIELARMHDHVGNVAAARVEAHRAAAALADLDVVLADTDIALLQRLGAAHAASAGAPGATATLARQQKGWVVACGDSRAKLTESKGLRYLAELVRNPGAERHALDLVDQVEGLGATPGIADRRHLGDAGELLDARARTAYRHRIEALRSEIDDALAAGAENRAERQQGELDQLVNELARAFGVGGRERRAASAAERARVNVTRALRTAVSRICDVLPEAGAVLDRGVRTGLYCAYRPNGGDAVHWIVHS